MDESTRSFLTNRYDVLIGMHHGDPMTGLGLLAEILGMRFLMTYKHEEGGTVVISGHLTSYYFRNGLLVIHTDVVNDDDENWPPYVIGFNGTVHTLVCGDENILGSTLRIVPT